MDDEEPTTQLDIIPTEHPCRRCGWCPEGLTIKGYVSAYWTATRGWVWCASHATWQCPRCHCDVL